MFWWQSGFTLFNTEVLKTSLDNNIYLSALSSNSTHLLQSVDDEVFDPIEKQWRLMEVRIQASKSDPPTNNFPRVFLDHAIQ